MGTDGISQIEVAIIGAGESIVQVEPSDGDFLLTACVGWYGLVAARTYLRLRPSTKLIIIDSDNTVGGVWSKDRLYPNLVAQVRHGVSSISTPQGIVLGVL